MTSKDLPISDLGFKSAAFADLQLTTDIYEATDRDIPLTFKITPANRNDGKVFPKFLAQVLRQDFALIVLTVDAEYDHKHNYNLCSNKVKPVIGYNRRSSGIKVIAGQTKSTPNSATLQNGITTTRNAERLNECSLA